MDSENSLVPAQQQPTRMVPAKPPSDWQVMSETFETMGKVGLAMTVGFSVAAAFCKMVDSGRIKMPSVANVLTQISEAEQQA